MTVRYENGQLSESRINQNSPISLARLANLNAGGLWIVRDDLPPRKRYKTVCEIIGPVRRYIDPILWNSFERLDRKSVV